MLRIRGSRRDFFWAAAGRVHAVEADILGQCVHLFLALEDPAPPHEDSIVGAVAAPNDRHDTLPGDVTSHDQDVGFVEGTCVQELPPEHLRAVNVRCVIESQAPHLRPTLAKKRCAAAKNHCTAGGSYEPASDAIAFRSRPPASRTRATCARCCLMATPAAAASLRLRATMMP